MKPIYKSVSNLLFVLLLLCGTCVGTGSRNMVRMVSATSSTSESSTMTTPILSSTETASVSEPSSGSASKNPIGAVVGYVKNSITRTVNGCGELWANYGTCNDIRAKIKVHQDALKDDWVRRGLYEANSKELKQKLQETIGGITYDEYVFLQKGKEDRSKVMSLAFLSVGAPRFLPYALMFQPDMLPTPLKPPKDEATGETFLEKQSRERSGAIIQMLLNLEKEARTIPLTARLNVFGRAKQEEKLKSMQNVNHEIENFLEHTGVQSRQGARKLLERLEPFLYSHEEFPRDVNRISQMPMSITKGIGNALLGEGFLTNLSPAFMQRGRLIGHLKKIAEADSFLVEAQVDLSTLTPESLREACSERFIGSPGMCNTDLISTLEDWLTLVEQEPGQRQEMSSSTLYYNGNLARTALMSYYALQGTQDDGATCKLPRLLYRGNMSPPSDPHEGEEPRTMQNPFRIRTR